MVVVVFAVVFSSPDLLSYFAGVLTGFSICTLLVVLGRRRGR